MPGPKGGRPRKPDALKRLHGTAKKGDKQATTPNPSGKAKIPVGLSAQARRIWKSLSPKLHELGLLTEVDASMFGTYCQAYGDWLELTRKLNKLGVGKIYQTTQGGYRQVIPEVGARNTAFPVMSKSGRASVSIPRVARALSPRAQKLLGTQQRSSCFGRRQSHDASNDGATGCWSRTHHRAA